MCLEIMLSSLSRRKLLFHSFVIFDHLDSNMEKKNVLSGLVEILYVGSHFGRCDLAVANRIAILTPTLFGSLYSGGRQKRDQFTPQGSIGCHENPFRSICGVKL